MSVTAPETSSGGGGRWCPTAEQVMLLEGMYRGGLITPTATQIQQITARLSVYGKIQGKNVFYWFQNHKARDRQKLRKKLISLYHLPHHHHPFLNHHEGGGIEDASRCKNMKKKWQMDDETSKSIMSPLMMMMDHKSTTPHCTRVPPKTLQLFPLTKDDPSKP